MTNGDLLRGMSDAELAVMLMCPNDTGMAEIECTWSKDQSCYRCTLNWLHENAKERKKSNEGHCNHN